MMANHEEGVALGIGCVAGTARPVRSSSSDDLPGVQGSHERYGIHLMHLESGGKKV